MPDLGKTLVTIGAIIAAIGLLLMLSAKLPWLGRLPGDIFIRKENFSFYMPITTSILLSILLSLILWLLKK